MPRRAAWIFIILLLGLIPAGPASAVQKVKQEVAAPAPKAAETDEREKVFNAESFELDNGMQVIVIPNNRAPVVTHMVWYKVGAADEAWGHSGLAHFLEHLMFKGSDRIGGEPLAPGEFSKIVRGLGGKDNAFTTKNYTAYYQSVPADQLETVMRMEAGRMRGLNPPEEEVKSELKVVMEERRQRTDNDPRGQFGEQLTSAAFINHPYGIPVIGWMQEMQAMNWADAKAFYDQWYAPNNAILVVSGDVSPADVFQLAIDIYGSIPAMPVPKRAWPQSPALNSRTSVTLESESIREPLVQTLFRVPSTRQNKDESLALDVLAEIMGGGSTSRLYKALVVDQKIASSAGLDYDGNDWEDSTLWIYAAPLPGQSLESVHDALIAGLNKLIKDGVSDAELKDAKTRMQDQAIYARDSLTGPAMIIGAALATGSSLDDVEYWPHDIAKVTAKQVQDVAAKYLNDAAPYQYPPVTGYLLPKNGASDPAPEESESP